MPDHLLLCDSDDLIDAKEKAAEEVFLKIERKFFQEQLYQNRTQKYNCEMGITTGSGDELSYDSYFDIRVDHERADENGNYGGIVNDHKSPDISDLRKFSCALPKCYPFTFHLMCNGWNSVYNEDPISHCPLCPRMENWRKNNSLCDKVNGYTCRDLMNKRISGRGHNQNGLKMHLKSSCADSHFHLMALYYLEFCEEKLPKLVDWYIDKNRGKVLYQGNKTPQI